MSSSKLVSHVHTFMHMTYLYIQVHDLPVHTSTWLTCTYKYMTYLYHDLPVHTRIDKCLFSYIASSQLYLMKLLGIYSTRLPCLHTYMF